MAASSSSSGGREWGDKNIGGEEETFMGEGEAGYLIILGFKIEML